MTSARAWLVVIACCLVAGCEKFDPEPDNGEEDTELVVPRSVGLGTQVSPYTVEQVIKGDSIDSQLRWFVGYAVGSTHSTIKNALFQAETTNVTNILLASDSTCEDVSRCVPVELSSASLQKAFSLHYNSHRFRQCIVVQGRFGQYFRVNGVRDVQTGYWLPDLDLSTIKTAPTEWQERDERY
ncbi:MAG: hypothetical protein IJ197_04230 [Bacteroidaceae bacterium]|nr:hypothetical protein [Bacteroidaceae bacterium]